MVTSSASSGRALNRLAVDMGTFARKNRSGSSSASESMTIIESSKLLISAMVPLALVSASCWRSRPLLRAFRVATARTVAFLRLMRSSCCRGSPRAPSLVTKNLFRFLRSLRFLVLLFAVFLLRLRPPSLVLMLLPLRLLSLLTLLSLS